MKNIRIFYLEIFPFLVVKLSIYLNRRVFVMYNTSPTNNDLGGICISGYTLSIYH